VSVTHDETTAEWVEAEMTSVLDSFDKDEVEKTLPLIFLLMAQEFGYEELQPKIQNAVQLVLIAAGVRPDSTEDQSKTLVEDYVKKLHGQVNLDLLRGIQNVFKRHYEALGKKGAEGFKKLSGADPVRAPKEGEEKPEGAVTLDALKFPRRL
jgi:hypothetical protein